MFPRTESNNQTVKLLNNSGYNFRESYKSPNNRNNTDFLLDLSRQTRVFFEKRLNFDIRVFLVGRADRRLFLFKIQHPCS